ncbi:MAG TPA: outer membrane beta-barrel protein [Dissulfurispiraceae bacterium]|nr:outer membrane beta-barrel protein [Dissulfurispiraceae bacterium]
MKIISFVMLVIAVVMVAPISGYALDYTADLSLGLSEQYNDNIFLANTNKVHDYITAIAPSLALSTRTAQSDVMLSYSPIFNFYKNNSDQNNVSHAASLVGHYRPTDRLVLGLSDTFASTRESSAIRAIQGAGPISRTNERITTNTLAGDLSYRLTAKISLLANTGYIYTKSQSGTDDVSSYTGGLGASYAFNDRTVFRINGTYTYFDYKNSSNANDSTYTAGINYRLTPTIVIDAFGGIVITKVDEPKRTNTGFTGGLTATKTFERGTASISYLQSVIAGVESTTPVKQQTVTLRYAAPIIERLDATASVFYSRYRAIGGTVTAGTENRDDIGESAELTYRILPWLNGFISYSHINSDDKTDGSGSYRNNIVTAGIRLTKQARF